MIRLSKKIENMDENLVKNLSPKGLLLEQLTIIIPTLNRQAMLTETLNSLIVLKEVVSIIVVDDGSTSKVKFNHPKVIVIRNGESLGEGMSINLGLKHVRTQFVAVISDDDPQGENWLPEIFKMINRKPGRIAYAPSNFFVENGVVVKTIIANNYAAYEIHYFDFMPCLAGVVINLHVLDQKKISQLRTNHIYPNDFLQWMMLSKYGKIQPVPRSFAFWNIHQTQTSAIISIDSKAKMYLENVTSWKKENLECLLDFALAATLVRYFQMVITRNKNRQEGIPDKAKQISSYITANLKSKKFFILWLAGALLYLSLRKLLTIFISRTTLIYLTLLKKYRIPGLR
jgi:glycosyltransferase involved in cell wall biosynthesis